MILTDNQNAFRFARGDFLGPNYLAHDFHFRIDISRGMAGRDHTGFQIQKESARLFFFRLLILEIF